MFELDINVGVQLEREPPPNCAEQQTRYTYDAAENIGAGIRKPWIGNSFAWTAPGFSHGKLFFEQPNLERYGHYHVGDCVQSVLSTAHFFGSIPAMPYMAGIAHNDPCDYTLGHYRPGNCNPHRNERLPLSLRGLIIQSANSVGLIFAL